MSWLPNIGLKRLAKHVLSPVPLLVPRQLAVHAKATRSSVSQRAPVITVTTVVDRFRCDCFNDETRWIDADWFLDGIDQCVVPVGAPLVSLKGLCVWGGVLEGK